MIIHIPHHLCTAIKFYYSGRFDLSEVTLALSVMTSLSNIIKEFSVDFSSMMTDLKLSCTYFDMIEDNSFYLINIVHTTQTINILTSKAAKIIKNNTNVIPLVKILPNSLYTF